MLALWGELPRQGLAIASDRDIVRHRRGAAAAVPLLRLRPQRSRCQLAGALSLDSGLDQLQAHLSALMTYRIAAGVLAYLLPVAAGTSHETLRGRTLKLGEQLRRAATVAPEPIAAAAPAQAISLSLDSTYIRSCHEGERHLEPIAFQSER